MSALDDIVVATDFSPSSMLAVRRAALLPMASGATIRVLHVLSPRLPAKWLERVEVEAHALLAEAADSLTASAKRAGRKVESVPVLARGQPHEQILRDARRHHARLIVMGRGGKRSLRTLFVGSTTDRVVRDGELPVLVVTARAARPYRRPLVAIDVDEDLETERRVVELAIQLTEAATPRLLLVHAFDVPFEGRLRSAMTAESLREYRRQCKEKAARELRRVQRELVPVAISAKAIVRSGDPRAVIAHEAARRGADLIAMGTHRSAAITRFVLGSVAMSTLRSAACDVLVRPPRSTVAGLGADMAEARRRSI